MWIVVFSLCPHSSFDCQVLERNVPYMYKLITMQGHHGTLSFDGSFKIMKFIRVNGLQAYAACITFMNALGGIVGMYLTQSTSLSELYVELQQLRGE